MGNNIHNAGASRPTCFTTISFPATSMPCFCTDMIRGLFTVYWMYSSAEWCTLTPIEWLLNYCHDFCLDVLNHVQTDWYPKSQCQSNKRCLLLKQICSRCSNLDPWTHSYVQFQWDSDHSNGRKNWLDTATWLRNVTFYDSQVVNDEPRLRLTLFSSVPRWCYVMETQDVQTLALSRGCPCQAMICVDLLITLGLIFPNFLIGYNSNLFLLGPGRNCRLKSHWSRMVAELVEGGSMRKDQSTTWTITALLTVDLLKLFGCLLDCNASGRCLLVSCPYLSPRIPRGIFPLKPSFRGDFLLLCLITQG